MAELLSPGVFIEERPSQIQQVNAVSTSNYATIGYTEKGPEDKATLVTSLEQFFNIFGGFTKHSDLPYGMVNFFQNGGSRAYVVRVSASDAVAATKDLETVWNFTANSRGAWGNRLRVTLRGNRNFYDVETATYNRFDVLISEETTDGSGEFDVKETFEALNLSDEDSAQYLEPILNSETTGSDLIDVTELNGGVPSALQSTQVTNESIGTGDGSQQSFSVTLGSPVVALDTLQISVAGQVVAIDNGEGSIAGVSGNTVTGTIDYETGSLEVFFGTTPTLGQAITASYYQSGEESVAVDLEGGSDGTPSSIGRSQISASSLALQKKGVYALDEIDEILNIGLMDFSDDATISLDLLAYAENRSDCFVILDTGEGLTAQQAVRYKRQTLASLSEYGGIYWPRIKMADELRDGVPKVVSPVGIVAGIFARTDTSKNVGKAPAGVDDGQLNGVIEIETRTTKGDRDTVFQANVNPLREDTQVGRAVWGASTLAITGDFTRINARRLFLFLEKSIFNSTHDLVFENIGQSLFSRIKLRLDGFLQVLFEDGYFAGNTPEQAYRVVVDESNNTDASIRDRQVIVDVYISVNEPAEFIRLRFQRQFPNTNS